MGQIRSLGRVASSPVEQAFGAGRFCRRLLVDHEALPQVSKIMIRLSAINRFVHALTL